MIQIDTTTYDAESTDVSTRVNVVTTFAGEITVRLGDSSDGFLAGDVIEFLNDGPATIVFGHKGFTTTVSLDQEIGPVPTLLPKQRAVAYYIGPNDYQWDVQTSQGVNQSTAFMFQVGVPSSGHIHTATMSVQQAKNLIHGTWSSLPVGGAGQPSVVLRSYPNSETGNPLHYHELTVYFDYVNHRFVVTNITNNTLDNHIAIVIGDGAPSLPTQVVSIGTPPESPASTFVFRSLISEMSHYSTYQSYLNGYSAPWTGEFDPSTALSGIVQNGPKDVYLDSAGATAILGTVKADATTPPELVCEFVLTQLPSNARGFYVGVFTQAYGPPYSPSQQYGGPLSSWYSSENNGASIGGYGGASATGLPTWQFNDVLGVVYNSTTSQVAFFRNGTLVGTANMSNNVDCYPMCGIFQTS
jgi:hypothetical protein